MKKNRWIGLAAAGVMLALPALAQKAPEAKDVRRKTVIVRGDQVEVRGDREHPRALVFIGGGYLGISPVALTDDLRSHFGVAKEAGVMVGGIFDDTPAARAGLRVGDIITQVDGQKVRSSWDISHALREKKKGDQVRIDYVRARAPQHLFVTLDERRGETSWNFRFPEIPPITIDRAEMEKALEGVRGLALAPEARARIFAMGADCEDLQARIKELEKRLKELEKRLK